MAYTINKTNGSVVATVADGTIDTTTDLTLVGKNYNGYGEFLNEKIIFKGTIGRIRDIEIERKTGKIFLITDDGSIWRLQK